MLLPFFYHTISDEDLPHCKHLFPIKTVKQFEEDLEFLLMNFEPLRIDDLQNWKQLKKPKFLLTFDDGMREVGELIAPILQKKGIPAVFFVSRDFAQHKSIFHKHLISVIFENFPKSLKNGAEILRTIEESEANNSSRLYGLAEDLNIDLNSLKHSELYLSESEIKTLSDQGFLIGSHSLNHPHFQNITEEEGHEQISKSIDWLMHTFQPPIATFAFPFEDYFLKKPFFEKLNDLPFSPEITFGTSEGKIDPIPYSIQRIDAEKNGWPIERIIRNYRRKKLLRQLFGKNKIDR